MKSTNGQTYSLGKRKTLPFLRTSEFLWQEGHTAQRPDENARHKCNEMLDIYKEVVEGVLAVPVYEGQKLFLERFAGAVDTYSNQSDDERR